MSGGDSRTMRLPTLDRRCAACAKAIPPDSRFCPSCGAEVERPRSPKELSQAAAVDALLTEANLLRVRQDWDRAEARCLDGLRLDPNNLLAHSLLGDLYRDQGRLDHAAQWYQLALDLDPSNASLRAKLKEAEEELAKRLVSAVHHGPSGPIPSGTQRLAGLPPSAWLNGLWAALGIFLILAAILIASGRSRKSRARDTTSDTTTTTSTTNARKGPGLFVLPAQRPRTTQNPRSPLAPPVSNQPAVAAPLEAARPTPANNGPVPAGTADSTVVSVTPTPQRDGAAVVLAQQQAEGEAADALRQRTIRNAYRAAYSLFGANPGYQRIALSVRVAPAGLILFSGEISRSAIERVTDVGDYVQTFSAFANPWWNPDLVQEAQAPADTSSAPAPDNAHP